MATVSAWAKPGAWALASEEHDAMELQHQKERDEASASASASDSSFPSLAVAASAKTSKKKKSQSLSLAEFTTGKSVTYGAAKFQPSHRSSASPDPYPSKGLTANEQLLLPTGPRERTAEELEQSRGFNYSSYGGNNRSRGSGEESTPRWGSSRVSDEPRRNNFSEGGANRDSGPSRADETDDWGAGKRSVLPSTPERRERGGGFFDSHSRADESDSWVSNKSVMPSSDGRRMDHRERRGGFEMFNRDGSSGGGIDSDTWGRKREEGSNGTGFESDTWGRKREEGTNGGGFESDIWGRKKEEVGGGGGRSRLVLQPRSQPVDNDSNGEQKGSIVRSKGSNPFGQARPREEVLAEKGQDWKKIDEKLEFVKIREASPEGSSFGKKSFGMGNGPEDRTERAWRKPDIADAPPPREEKVDERPPDN